ncbi:MAG: cobalamin-dependent protein [Desulfobacterales bacterium]|nr:cobalamin-dependent protein [Desulfobacterales bacterium]
MEREGEKIKIVMGKMGMDCHDTGIMTLAYQLREEGFEVVYLGLHNSPKSIYLTAVQEDADVIGISFLSGQHMHNMKNLMELINGKNDFLVLVGGVIRRSDIPELKKIGVNRVYQPGTTSYEVAEYIRSNVKNQTEN